MNGSSPEAVGVLGGSFDPVHLGHLTIAGRVRKRLALSRMLLVPAAVPPHKPPDQLSPGHHREAMLRLALEDAEGLELCRLELDLGRVCYTVDTLRALRDGSPPCRPIFVLGMDSLLQIETWRDHHDLVREFDLVVLDREGDGAESAGNGLERWIGERIVPLTGDVPREGELDRLEPGRGGRIFHFRSPRIPISSSMIRGRAAAGDDLAGLVSPAVAGYIQRTGLYRREESS
jgi:nicotinate-nucleotide adenylyltransferase